MVMEREISEYRDFCSALEELRGRYSERKKELRLLLEQALALKKEAYLVLLKANRLTRRLTGRQRQATGLNYRLGEIKERIARLSPAIFHELTKTGEALAMPNDSFTEIPSEALNSLDLRRRGLSVLQNIDRLKKDLLQIGLLEHRCRELIASINKALEAFRFEYRAIRRKLFPLGIFSFCRRSIGLIWGNSYFSFNDMGELAVLAGLTGHVLKIADSPII